MHSSVHDTLPRVGPIRKPSEGGEAGTSRKRCGLAEIVIAPGGWILTLTPEAYRTLPDGNVDLIVTSRNGQLHADYAP